MVEGKARDFLRKYSDLSSQCDSINERLERVNAKLTHKGINYEGGSGGGSGGYERTPALLIQIESLQEQLNSTQELKSETLREIYGVVVQLSPDCYEVLYKRYVELKSFRSIAVELKRSESWVFKHHSDGLDEVIEVMEGMYEENNL